jgi:NTP pyrophosphatase (non-canonical NTP hydrolase)
MENQNIYDWYQEQAKRTCADLGNEKLNLSHMVLGIISEQEEFLNALNKEDIVNQKEELADMAFYVANYCTYRGYSFKDIMEDNDSLISLENSLEENVSLFDLFTSRLADYVKKHIAYNKEINKYLEKRALTMILYSLTIEDCNFCDDDLVRNIEKLKVRFPKKFSEEKALNRDLITERKILES